MRELIGWCSLMEIRCVNADRGKPATEFGMELPWVPSPEPGVARKLLERIGGEVALATSIVRYEAGSCFARHCHDLGEEFLVLEGVFSDEHGHFRTGTYVRNPPGSSHAPFSTEGCVIFVKLRQMSLDEVDRTVITPQHLEWSALAGGGERADLNRSGRVSVALERLPAGATRVVGGSAGGEEIFLVDGEAAATADPSRVLKRWTWLRRPPSEPLEICMRVPVTLWIKQGHLR
jgi:hypothetical protein